MEMDGCRVVFVLTVSVSDVVLLLDSQRRCLMKHIARVILEPIFSSFDVAASREFTEPG